MADKKIQVKQTIYKYPWPVANPSCMIEMPVGAEILALQLQGDTPTIWVKINPEETEKEYRHFEFVGTGWPFEFDGEFITTLQMPNGLVFHFFEVQR